MIKQVNCFIANNDEKSTQKLINQLAENETVNKIFVLSNIECKYNNASCIVVNNYTSSETLLSISTHCSTEYCLFALNHTSLEICKFAINRMYQSISWAGCVMIYGDYLECNHDKQENHTTIEYQIGSIRNNFDFGYLQLYHSAAIKEYVQDMEITQYAAFYGLRLQASRLGKIMRLPEVLSIIKNIDFNNNEDQLQQLEFEDVCTNHLMYMGAKLTEDEFRTVAFKDNFSIEASIIISSNDCSQIIEDAIKSALTQVCDFRFNIIIVVNSKSIEKANNLLTKYNNEKLLVLIAENSEFSIGNYWNKAINNIQCGQFIFFLDENNVFYNENSMQKIVDCFYSEACAMVIGSNISESENKIINHRTWSSKNGPNNILRLDEVGTSFAFYTKVARSLQFPNTNFGMDYALALASSRQYQTGIIHDTICKQTEPNKPYNNQQNNYLDTIRSLEIILRIRR